MWLAGVRWSPSCCWGGLISAQVGPDLTHSYWAQHIASWHSHNARRRKLCNRVCHHSFYTHIPSPRKLSGLDQDQCPRGLFFIPTSCKILNNPLVLYPLFLLSLLVQHAVVMEWWWAGFLEQECVLAGLELELLHHLDLALIKGWLLPLHRHCCLQQANQIYLHACTLLPYCLYC